MPPIRWGPTVIQAQRSLVLPASADTGAIRDVAGMTKLSFQIASSGVVNDPVAVAFYYTIDRNTAYGTGNVWSLITAPSEQSGTGIISNPITAVDGTQSMAFTGAGILAYRVTTNAFTGGGSVLVSVLGEQ